MKFICEKCKNEVNDSVKFCPHCGSEFLGDSGVDKKALYADFKKLNGLKFGGLKYLAQTF